MISLPIPLWCWTRGPLAATPDSQEFNPVRFLNKDIKMMGPDFQLILVSVERRQCSGTGMIMEVVEVVDASLLRGFEWRCYNHKPKEFDMSEKPGPVRPRSTDVAITQVPRIHVHVYYRYKNSVQCGHPIPLRTGSQGSFSGPCITMLPTAASTSPNSRLHRFSWLLLVT